jgi:flagellar brake protein
VAGAACAWQCSPVWPDIAADLAYTEQKLFCSGPFMNSAHDKPHSIVSSAEDVRAYTLSSATEIAYQLRVLINRREMVTVYFGRGAQFLLTKLISADVDKKRFCFDPGPNPEINQQVLLSERTVFVAAPDGIKTQFVCGRPREGQDKSGRLFICDFPAALIKMQRREYFRVDTPIANPIQCQIGLPVRRKLPLHDVSLGGLSFLSASPLPEMQRMALLTDCRIDLPGHGALTFDLEVRNQHPHWRAGGGQQLIIGCRFLNISPRMQNLLQRYLIQLERERRALS